MRTILTLLTCLIIFILGSATAQAQLSERFTSTADFNSGLKSDSQNNREIETRTDNFMNADGSFLLGNGRGDNFVFCSATDTWKWNFNTVDFDADTTSTIRVCNNDVFRLPGLYGNIASVAAGQGDISAITNRGFLNAKGSGVDLDIRVQLSNPFPDPRAGSTIATLTFLLRDGDGDYTYPLTVDDEMAWTGTCTNACANYVWQASYRVDGGATVNVFGGSVSLSAVDPVWLRLRTQTTGASQWFYSINGVTWIQQAAISNPGASWFSGPSPSGDDMAIITARLQQNTNAASVLAPIWGSFTLSSGSPSLISSDSMGGYRREGNWTSANQSGANPNSVIVDYTGATSNSIIDYIRIVDHDENLLWTNDTNITSGTRVSLDIPADGTGQVGSSWRVVIGLAGNGNFTASVLSVTVGTSYISNAFWTLCFVAGLVAILMLAFWIRKKREATT